MRMSNAVQGNELIVSPVLISTTRGAYCDYLVLKQCTVWFAAPPIFLGSLENYILQTSAS